MHVSLFLKECVCRGGDSSNKVQVKQTKIKSSSKIVKIRICGRGGGGYFCIYIAFVSINYIPIPFSHTNFRLLKMARINGP